MVSCKICGKEISSKRECIICEEVVCSTHYRSMMGVCLECAPMGEE